MVTKNLHLELVSDLTTTAFIAALERFINRRGPVRKMFSDNGTNFVGASNELHQLYTDFRSEAHCRAVNDFLLPREIEWHFIPPQGTTFWWLVGGRGEECQNAPEEDVANRNINI